ncbi:MAG: SufD family Fe-S cluster assembly protein [bacterium]|nr:SufD family Fe-S cluster assembly protein [bacterium]
MADPTTVHPQVLSFVRGGESCFSPDDREHALDLARRAPVPSRFEEDWRRNDPDAFPWNRLEEVDAGFTRRDVRVQVLGHGASGLVPLEVEGTDRCRAMQLIAGDDYDAKFLYYHKALSRDPVCFRVMPKFRGGAPVELVQAGSGPGLATFTTVLVIERGAELVLYDRWEIGDGAAAGIGRSEIVVEEGARLVYITEDQAGAAPFYRRGRVRLERNAKLEWYSATPGAAWHVARLEIELAGSGSEAVFKGLFAGTAGMKADHRTHQYHSAPNARSELTIKTLLSGGARSVYQGLITVPQQAQKTDAYQQCRNLLLDSGTHADAIPKLEIIADDVRCTHGVSMGSVNKEQLFYLQSRGLTRRQAVVTIASGFAEEIIRHVPVEMVQERWRNLVSTAVGRMKAEG